MRSIFIWFTAIAILIGLALILYEQPFFHRQKEALIPAAQKTTAETEEPVVHYPVPGNNAITEPVTATEPETKIETPLPGLAESDETLQEVITQTLNEQKLLALILPSNFIQRFVVTIDSLPEKRISPHHLPVKSPQGKFLVVGSSISPDNAKRYTPYLQLVESLGLEQAVSIYVRFYALFQEAYRELGYPKGHFNDRFVEVIDHLLETPQIKDPIGVVQPLIVYKYTDSELEGLSAGQKLMLRIGSNNRARAMEILRNLRQRLTSLGKSKQG